MDLVTDCLIVTDCFIVTDCLIDLVTDCLIVTDFHSYRLFHSYRMFNSYRLFHSYRLFNRSSYRLFNRSIYRLLNSYRLQRLSVKMSGFNSKVVCKNSSVTIWEILFNITIPIIHHKYRGGLVIARGVS